MEYLCIFYFTDEADREDEEAMFEHAERDMLYAGRGEVSFFEFLNTVLCDVDIFFIFKMIKSTSKCTRFLNELRNC